jgi:hypothetical protein
MKNFHLPLPEQTYRQLRVEAERARVPTTTLAREAIDQWLTPRRLPARNSTLTLNWRRPELII